MSVRKRSARSPMLFTVPILLALLLSMTSCSKGNGTVAPDAKKASTALSAGLKAHSAGNLKAAKADYETALKYDHKNKYALYNLVLLDAANGNYGLAEDKYRAVLGLDPKYGPALFNLAILRNARGDSKEAISLYERTVAADKTAAAAWLNLGLLQRANGQKTAGDTSVATAIRLNPNLKDPGKASSTGLSVLPSASPKG